MNLSSKSSKPELDPVKNEDFVLDEKERKELETPKENSFYDIFRFSVIAILIVLPIRMFIAQPFIVSGASMKETFHNGDYLIVDQISYRLNEPKRGDVVVFHYPRDPSKFFIKRIIGLPGDTISIEGRKVTISNKDFPDGFVINEPYIKSMSEKNFYTERLNENEYFVMGDNRDESSDSRSWGILQKEKIVGKAFLRLYPTNAINFLPGAYDLEPKNNF